MTRRASNDKGDTDGTEGGEVGDDRNSALRSAADLKVTWVGDLRADPEIGTRSTDTGVGDMLLGSLLPTTVPIIRGVSFSFASAASLTVIALP